jgi:glutathione synthase/RimK-type ligase-like ATP-grasp enzyme
MKKTIAIIGQIPDPHIEKVSNLIREMGGTPMLFDRYQTNHLLELSVNSQGPGGYFRDGSGRISFKDIETVWWRWKPVVIAEYTGSFPRQSEAFASGEWRHVMYSLPDYLSHARWVNPLREHYLMHRKAKQLALAARVGLNVPDTAFTNDPAAVVNLFERHERVIYKPVKTFLVDEEHVIYTNEIHLEDVRQAPESIRMAPGIFQELVEKDYELRITVVGDRFFPVRINSQDRAVTQVDWRHSQLEDMYEVHQVDDSLRQLLLTFHRKAGLDYGAYDFIVRKSGEPVFLECNPGGQWLWLENALNLDISRALAQHLIGTK